MKIYIKMAGKGWEDESVTIATFESADVPMLVPGMFVLVKTGKVTGLYTVSMTGIEIDNGVATHTIYVTAGKR